MSSTVSDSTSLIASNIQTGLSDTTEDKSDPAITGSLTLNTNNLNILASQTYTQNTKEVKKTRTLMFNNHNSGNLKTQIHNTTISTKNNQNINFNVANNINLSYDGAKIINRNQNGIIKTSDQDMSYLVQLTDTDSQYSNKIQTDDALTVLSTEYADSVRGLTDAGTVAAVTAAVVATAATAGALGKAAAVGLGMTKTTATGKVVLTAGGKALAGGVAGGITGAATTAGLSATQSSMNAEGDFWKQIKDAGKDSWDTTTDEESLKNIAIGAGVTAASSWAIHASGGSTSLERGGDAVYKPDPKLMARDPQYRAFVEARYPNYNGVIDASANNIGLANIAPTPEMIGKNISPYSTNPFDKNFWQGFAKEGGFVSNSVNQLGGMNSMSLSHDSWGQNALIQQPPILQLTILPSIAIQYCATFPAACGVVVSKDNLTNQ